MAQKDNHLALVIPKRRASPLFIVSAVGFFLRRIMNCKINKNLPIQAHEL